MLWGENKGRWKSQQSLGVEPRTPLAWVTSALLLSYNSRTATSPHNPLYVLCMFSERIFLSTPNKVQMARTWWLLGVRLRHSVPSLHWWLKPEVSWVWLLVTAGLFTFLYFCHITSKFIFFQHEARCSKHIRNAISVCLITSLTLKWNAWHIKVSKNVCLLVCCGRQRLNSVCLGPEQNSAGEQNTSGM